MHMPCSNEARQPYLDWRIRLVAARLAGGGAFNNATVGKPDGYRIVVDRSTVSFGQPTFPYHAVETSSRAAHTGFAVLNCYQPSSRTGEGYVEQA
jgi:hypothetical protein